MEPLTIHQGGPSSRQKDGGPMAERRPDAGELARRIALFTATLAADQCARLLEQLVPTLRDEAIRQVGQLRKLDPTSRRGRVARMFGERPDASERLRALVGQAGPHLARILLERTPAHHRGLRAESTSRMSDPEPSRLGNALVARLLKEAIR